MERLAISFESDVATTLKSADQAIMMHHLYFWVKKNEANESEFNFHDGRYWTFNSIKGFARIFTWMSEKSIRNTLQKLKDGGYILTANYNKVPYDRTLWYALSDEGYSLMRGCTCPNGNAHLPKTENLNTDKGKPIPYSNTYSNTDENKDNTVQMGFERFWLAYPKKQGKAMAEKAWKKIKPSSELMETIMTKLAQFKKTEQWTKDKGKFIPMPATWLNQRRWEDTIYDTVTPSDSLVAESKPKMSYEEAKARNDALLKAALAENERRREEERMEREKK